ncbi:8528_t:CDS:2 [Acaulospora morrowiae]|uniref:8528_t:CDS:1 n=1 Tax=Acaulospora morrowiae TaxID=94023 RepID=A0A9N8YUB8_9GLOM|nr:8528_t:CDS:2 [Acaulospora morrowiae]
MSENASDISDIAPNPGICRKSKTRKSLENKTQFLKDIKWLNFVFQK